MPKSHCRACNEKDTKEMVSCCHCRSWWHFVCVGVNASIADDDRTFNCPDCQRPSGWVPLGATPNPSRATSKDGSVVGSTASTRAARLAQLQLEKLEAGRQLALKRIELEGKRREAEMEMMRFQLEQTVMNESFRLRQLLELENDEDDDHQSVRSEQISFGKVQQWDAFNSTMHTSAKTATATGELNSGAAMTHGITYDGLQQALAGISLDQAALEPTLGGGVVVNEKTVVPTAEGRQLGILPPSFPKGADSSNPLLGPNMVTEEIQTSLAHPVTPNTFNLQSSTTLPGGLSTGNVVHPSAATSLNSTPLTVESLLTGILGVVTPGLGPLPAPKVFELVLVAPPDRGS